MIRTIWPYLEGTQYNKNKIKKWGLFKKITGLKVAIIQEYQ
jgi:hypothetical protein